MNPANFTGLPDDFRVWYHQQARRSPRSARGTCAVTCAVAADRWGLQLVAGVATDLRHPPASKLHWLSSHAWLTTDDGRIFDPTAQQFLESWLPNPTPRRYIGHRPFIVDSDWPTRRPFGVKCWKCQATILTTDRICVCALGFAGYIRAIFGDVPGLECAA